MNAIRFVRTASNVYLLQVENENVFRRWGFALVDDDGITYEGGFGFSPWIAVPDDEVPSDVRERFRPVIESFEE
jgi:hypothetical protein